MTCTLPVARLHHHSTRTGNVRDGAVFCFDCHGFFLPLSDEDFTPVPRDWQTESEENDETL